MADTDRGSGRLSTLIPTFGAAALGLYLILGLKLGPGFAIPMGVIGLLAGVAGSVLLGPIGRSIARRIHKEPPEDEVLEDMQIEMENLRGRLIELEERLDFAERLLTRESRKEIAQPGTN